MPRTSTVVSPEKFTTFGDLLRFLRRKADLTQRELSIAVGYSESQISRLEQNERAPDEVTLAARFVPALYLEDEPQWIARLLELANAAAVDEVPRAETSTALPTGTVTFLFTDIEGSTKLAQEYPDAIPALLARHHEILKQRVQAHNGHVFQIVGDSICAAFRSANEALEAALDAQRSLSNETWSPAPIKVRMGIHTGTAHLQDPSQALRYSGYATLAITQRIMSAGHGGQILVSQSAYDLTRDTLPERIKLVDLGKHRLKDALQPEQIYQLMAPDLPVEFPPLNSLRLFNHNLPAQLSSFVGREKEIAEIKEAIEKHRLVTLTGPGGTGKTRLSLQLAGELLESFADGTWFMEFASLPDPALVPQTMAAVLGVKEDPSQPILSTLAGHLADKKTLLILDNCEHLVQASANVVESLLLACPNLHILATSREMLGVAGERAFYVPSLVLPNLKSDAFMEAALQSEAVRLFVERARAVIPRFELNDKNVSAVVRVCHRLDGIPLAIELAAGRLKMMPVQQIADHIDDAFRLLTGGIRTATPRHQTLQALMDWSYNLLTEPEKTMFRRLAVFAGGWTIEAAEVIGGAQDVETGNVFDAVAHLVDKSLVLVDEQDNVARYHFLETVRQYALVKLAESGEADTIRRKHAEYYLVLAEKGAHPVGYQRGPAWYDQIEIEHDNFRAVLTWCQSVADGVQIGFRLTDVLFPFYYYRGYWSEGLSWVEAILAHPRAGNYPLEQAQLQRMLGTALVVGGADYSAGISYMIRSLKVFQGLNDRPNTAWSLHWLGLHARDRGDASTARARLEECIAIFQELGDDSARAAATNTLAEAIILQGEGSLAKTILENNLVLARKVGEIDIIGWALNHLGHVAQLERTFEQARQLHEESLPLFQRLGAHNQGTIWAHQSLGETRLAQGESSLAAAYFIKALESSQELGDTGAKAWCLAGLAGVSALNEEPERAAWLWGAAEALRERIGVREAPASRATHERLKSEVRQQLGEDVFNAKWAEGQSASMERAISEATR